MSDILDRVKAAHRDTRDAEAEVNRLSGERRRLVQETRDQGASVADIAEALGVSRTRVYKLLDPKYR